QRPRPFPTIREWPPAERASNTAVRISLLSATFAKALPPQFCPCGQLPCGAMPVHTQVSPGGKSHGATQPVPQVLKKSKRGDPMLYQHTFMPSINDIAVNFPGPGKLRTRYLWGVDQVVSELGGNPRRV